MTVGPQPGALSLDPTTGFLPLGRHRVTEADIHAQFVADAQFAASTTRSLIWDEYEDGRDLLRTKVRVHAVWLGGSFLTSKVDAKDIDALFIVSGRDFGNLDVGGRKIVNSFLPVRNAQGGTVRGHGLNRLDSYILTWRPFSPFDPKATPAHREYAAGRGYWDDWWPRDRHNKPNGVPTDWRDALPKRGYLEVELDAWDR